MWQAPQVKATGSSCCAGLAGSFESQDNPTGSGLSGAGKNPKPENCSPGLPQMSGARSGKERSKIRGTPDYPSDALANQSYPMAFSLR